METYIQKSEDDLLVILPQHIVEKYSLKDGGEALIIENDGVILIEFVKKQRRTIDDMLRGMPKDRQHGGFDWGSQ